VFNLKSEFSPAGDQPAAIKALCEALRNNSKDITLRGGTGTGKTFTMANVIKEMNLPALIMAPNKILSAQLYEEFKGFFPDNAVEYFVSYYDYYRPESYSPQKGLYLEKESSINEVIDQLRHSATRSLIERKDVIIIASISCIYGIGSYEAYAGASFKLEVGQKIAIAELSRILVEAAYEISIDLGRGKVKVQGQTVWIGPSHILDKVWRIKFEKNEIVSISEMDPLTRKNFLERNDVLIFPNSHHITPENSLSMAIKNIESELKTYLPTLHAQGKLAEAQRLEERVLYDIAQLKTMHTCSGVENYSRYFTNRAPGEHPPTLFEYFPRPFLLFVDESHIAVPQINGMFRGDLSRKSTLVDYGFRLPSCRDNRPMKFEEWDAIRPNTIFVSATPGHYEKERSIMVEQMIRPTGLLDPICVIKPTSNQLEDALQESDKVIAKGNRVLMLTLTKKTAEHLSEHLKTKNYKSAYLHGDLNTMERIEKLHEFRKGDLDIIIGVNLLREGIDVPECALICIFEADQEGFLRTESALIQMIGRAARHDEGRVILYADRETVSIKAALKETNRRRKIQEDFNTENNITPKRIVKKISDAFDAFLEDKKKKGVAVKKEWFSMKEKERHKLVKQLEKQMKDFAKDMKFEEAAKARDERNALLTLELNG
jgi:excinuclease ABC subunit B